MNKKGFVVPLIIGAIVVITAGIIFFVVKNPKTNTVATFQPSEIQPFKPLDSYTNQVGTNNQTVTNNSQQNLPIYPDANNSNQGNNSVATNGTNATQNQSNQNSNSNTIINLNNNSNSGAVSYLNNLATQKSAYSNNYFVQAAKPSTISSNQYVTNNTVSNNTKLNTTDSRLSSILTNNINNTTDNTNTTGTDPANTDIAINPVNTTYNSNYVPAQVLPIVPYSGANSTSSRTTTGTNGTTGTTNGNSNTGSNSSGILTSVATGVATQVATYALSEALMPSFGYIKITRITECTCMGSRLIEGADPSGRYWSLIVMPSTQVQLYGAPSNEYAITTGMQGLGNYSRAGPQCLVYHGEDCSQEGFSQGLITVIGLSY